MLMPLKSLFVAVALAAAAVPAVALAATLPLQGVLRSGGGGPVADGSYVIVASLYDKIDGQEPIWQELVNKVAVESGFFAFELGAVKAIDAALLESGQPLWLGIQVGGTDELPRVALAPVPSAWHAHVAAAGAFAYAASTEPAGAATALDCSACVTATMIAPTAIESSHVNFTYAGSASKGGAANEAAHALAADLATEADHAATATAAETAKTADFAKAADSATTAEEVKCTGCITLNHLADGVASGFLSTKGGTVQGPVTLSGGVDLSGSTLAGANLAAVDVSKDACAPALFGRIAIDSGSTKLHFCNGSVWKQLLTCESVCKPAGSVACGQTIVTDCGDPGGCKGTGTLCEPGKSCVAEKCVGVGETKDNPAASCKAILDGNAEAADGLYWVDLDGDGLGEAAELTCNMTGGGWTLLSQDDFEGSAGGWSPNTITACGSYGKILGGYNTFGTGNTATRTFAVLPAHTDIRVKLDFIRIDSWDGENGWLQIDGGQVWVKNGQHANGAPVCGSGSSGWNEEKWPVDHSMKHAAASLTVKVGSSLDSAPSDESWGMDNASVWML